MKVRLWINEKGLIVKFESVRTIGGEGKPEVLRKSISYNYDENIVIEPPQIKSKGKVKKNNGRSN
jgi:hypothetical protein